MTIDFYPTLSRTIKSLDPHTPAGRMAVYDRARQMLVSQLRARNTTPSEASAKQSALESAIERIETENCEGRQSVKRGGRCCGENRRSPDAPRLNSGHANQIR